MTWSRGLPRRIHSAVTVDGLVHIQSGVTSTHFILMCGLTLRDLGDMRVRDDSEVTCPSCLAGWAATRILGLG